MDSAQHHDIEFALSSFRSHCLSHISQSFSLFRQELAASEASTQSQFLSRFQRIEELLSGPYNRKLNWEWVPEAGASRTISQALVQRRIRLTDLPEFELSAKDYFAKFAQTSEAIVAGLSQLGFHLPPCSKLFDHFLVDVVDGKKLVVARADLRAVRIPDEQVDLAYFKAQKMIANDADLQKFLPRGAPETIPDKLYFLEIVNTLRGLEYKPVFPLSDREKQQSEELSRTVAAAYQGLTQVQVRGEVAGRLKRALDRQAELESYGVSEYLDMYARFQARKEQLETGEMASEN